MQCPIQPRIDETVLWGLCVSQNCEVCPAHLCQNPMKKKAILCTLVWFFIPMEDSSCNSTMPLGHYMLSSDVSKVKKKSNYSCIFGYQYNLCQLKFQLDPTEQRQKIVLDTVQNQYFCCDTGRNIKVT